MPNDRDDIELTEAEAAEHVKQHEKVHGHEMKVPPGQEKHNDVPTQADLDTDPEVTEGEEG